MPNARRKRGNEALSRSRKVPISAQYVFLGDDTRYINNFQDPIWVSRTRARLLQKVPKHDCNADCLPPIPNDDDPLLYLKSIVNPFLIPIVVFNFTRVMKKMPKGSGVNCPLCAYTEPEGGCPERHLVYVTPCGKVLYCPEHVTRFLHKARTAHNRELSVDMFTFSEHFHLHQTKEKAREYVADYANGLEGVPVSWINTNDKTMPKPTYRYIGKRNLDRSIEDYQALSQFRSRCTCTDNCEGNDCECKKLTRTENCNKPGYQHKRIYQDHKNGLFECNPDCPCDISCSNRVSQTGIWCRMQMFKSANKGWGLRALHFIPKGQFIARYNGRLVDSSLIGQGGPNEFQSAYIAGLDYIETAQGVKEGLSNVGRAKLYGGDARTYLVDGSVEGNLGRTFNHSCAPNLFVQSIFTDTHDLRFHDVALFANRDIHPFEELCWNYQYRPGTDNNRVLYCACGCLGCHIRLL